ncbi:GH36-type glycosyl hydrolase domain-containing protein [Reinekea blandensis]|uniref:NdvB protein n=1 Tax=Reinekea blandensis MED297 TaxID=314283 RepID=A4BJP1_9GAMM|nr:NdvB protein [Reinekea blandensis]EAR07681.1 NdvB protein [Reinekea sp. MED297] [Reinekea blandensis MED297]
MNDKQPLGAFIEDGQRYRLTSPTELPNADAFLWNAAMMIQATCRGYATAQFMQPGPAKYAHGPTLAAKTFMQPEHPYFAHHAGRFFYVKDHHTNTLWSAPYEPTRMPLDEFRFEPGLNDLRWVLRKDDLEVTLVLSLADDHPVECWRVSVTNHSTHARQIGLTPYFPVGYASWMNQSGDYDTKLNAVIARCVTPYQKLEDYPKQKHFKDLTFFAADKKPQSWSARLQAFEGEGGLHNPDALQTGTLDNQAAIYECPACIMNFEATLKAGATEQWTFLFGPAEHETEIAERLAELLPEGKIEQPLEQQRQQLKDTLSNTCIDSPDTNLNAVLNHWLPRQLMYHGQSQRLTTDPQTRNYLQDAMGMAYLDANQTRTALTTALQQQQSSGQMPDGILLEGATELTYINRIPHTDHGIWVILCLQAYLNESGDAGLLNKMLPFADGSEASIAEHVDRSLDWLLADRNEQGLSYIQQGDWCDPMNMVGPNGIGVSGWLTQALAVALNQWAELCRQTGRQTQADAYTTAYNEQSTIINLHLWDGDWFIRGITDERRRFGTKDDDEGQIFLNTQAWALMAGVASSDRQPRLIASVQERLQTPHGPMLCAPAFTRMHEDIGRVTQKFPGTGENGSVYNHAALFWSAGLFAAGENERAWQVIRDLWAFDDDERFLRRGQLPIYVPNYFRGAWHQFPETAGRSSRLFNTGTVAWAYRLFVENLLGLTGTLNGVRVTPFLPKDWPVFSAKRTFRGAHIELTVKRDGSLTADTLRCNDEIVDGFELNDLQAGQTYRLDYRVSG